MISKSQPTLLRKHHHNNHTQKCNPPLCCKSEVHLLHFSSSPASHFLYREDSTASTLAPKPRDIRLLCSSSFTPLETSTFYPHNPCPDVMIKILPQATNLAFLFDTFSLHSFTFHRIDFDVLTQ